MWVVHHDESRALDHVMGSETEGILRVERQRVMVHQRVITAPIGRSRIAWTGGGRDAYPLLCTTASQRYQTEHRLDSGNGQVINLLACSNPWHMRLNEARRELGYARAAIILIRMHASAALITAAAAASLALSRAGPFGSPIDRSSNVIPRPSAVARLALMVWKTFSLPCGNRDPRMGLGLLPGPVISLLCPAVEPTREPGLECSQNAVRRAQHDQ